jgi:hypothetical protein
MGIMTHIAGPEPRRAVFEFFVDDAFLVTGEAEFAQVLVVHVLEERLHFTRMGIVAIQTVFLRRFVDSSRTTDLASEFFVTAKAGLGRVVRLEVMAIGFLYMASLALSGLCHFRPMKMRSVGDRNVAVRVHTRS